MNGALCARKKAKNIIPFLSQNITSSFGQYRTIYEDETGHPPPVIMAEAPFYGEFQKGSGDPPFFPQDAIPNSIRHPSSGSFSDMGFTIQPSTSTGYSNYTTNMGEFGYFSATLGSDGDAAIAALPISTSLPARWHALLSSISIVSLHPNSGLAMKNVRDLDATVRKSVADAITGDIGTTAATSDNDPGVHNFYQHGYNGGWGTGNAVKASEIVNAVGANTTLDPFVAPGVDPATDPNKEIQMEVRIVNL